MSRKAFSLITLLAGLAWAQTGSLVKARPPAIPADLPRTVRNLTYGTATFGPARLWFRLFQLGEQDCLDLYTGGPRRRLTLDWTVTPTSVKATWLQPGRKASPLLVLEDASSFLVVAFPDGLHGRAVPKLFGADSTAQTDSTVALGPPDGKGNVTVLEEITDPDGTLKRTWHWTGAGWTFPAGRK